MLTIGDLARETGCAVQTVRHYEATGLLPPADRTAGNQRRYTTAHRDRLAFIRHGRELGFPIDAIRELLALSDHPDRSCEDADRMARSQLAAIDRQIERLQRLRRTVATMVAGCEGGRVEDCAVLQTVADASHSHCADPAHGDGQAAPPPPAVGRPGGTTS